MLWRCDTCTTLYAPDVPACPQCGATGHTLVDSGGRPVVEPEPAAEQPAAPEPAAPAKATAKPDA